MGRALVIVLVLLGCRAKQPQAVPVAITVWPKLELKREQLDCYIPEEPEEPELPPWPSADEDYYRRVYVHRADYDKLFQFALDQAHVTSALRDCLKRFTTVDE